MLMRLLKIRVRIKYFHERTVFHFMIRRLFIGNRTFIYIFLGIAQRCTMFKAVASIKIMCNISLSSFHCCINFVVFSSFFGFHYFQLHIHNKAFLNIYFIQVYVNKSSLLYRITNIAFYNY